MVLFANVNNNEIIQTQTANDSSIDKFINNITKRSHMICEAAKVVRAYILYIIYAVIEWLLRCLGLNLYCKHRLISN